MRRVKKEIKAVSGLDKLLEEVSINEVSKKRLSEKELLEYVWDNFEEVESKNGMLKRLRGEGLSCSMDRVFRMYGVVSNEKKLVKEIVEEEVKEVKKEVEEEVKKVKKEVSKIVKGK